MYEHSSQAPGLLSPAAPLCVLPYNILDHDGAVSCSLLFVQLNVGPGHLTDGVDVWPASANHPAHSTRRDHHLLGAKVDWPENRKKLRYGHMECTSGLIVTPTPFYGPRQWQPQCFTVHKGQVLTTVPCPLTFLGAAQYNDIILVVY